jgi:vitamin B12 transporter
VRHDEHSIFGNHTTFKVAPAWLVTDTTRLHASVGTGFKAPSLAQLYSSYGNPDLQSEESTGWDIGIDQDIVKNKASVSLTYFRNTFDNLISFDPATFVLENIESAQTEGLEVGTTFNPLDEISTRLAYTYTDTLNDQTGESLLRRPRNKAIFTAVYSPISRIRSQLQWQLYSSRGDYDYGAYPPTRIALAGYGIVNLAVSYQIDSNLEIISRINNLFDKEYEEVYGFGTMGATAFGGLKVTL